MRERDGGKFKRRLSEVNTRAVSAEQNELIDKFKMAGDMAGVGYEVHILSKRSW